MLQLAYMADGECFASDPMLMKNRDELHRPIGERPVPRGPVEWERLLAAQSIPSSRIRTVVDLVQGQLMPALGLLTAFPRPLIPSLRLIDLPVHVNGRRTAQHLPPSLLAQLSLFAPQIDQFRWLDDRRTGGFVGFRAF